MSFRSRFSGREICYFSYYGMRISHPDQSEFETTKQLLIIRFRIQIFQNQLFGAFIHLNFF